MSTTFVVSADGRMSIHAYSSVFDRPIRVPSLQFSDGSNGRRVRPSRTEWAPPTPFFCILSTNEEAGGHCRALATFASGAGTTNFPGEIGTLGECHEESRRPFYHPS